jgi:L-alanine-DL-glutamate epimerase-like enolase superfamily enzyme
MMTVRDVALHFLPIQTRMPLKFGSQTVTEVTCARVSITLEDTQGRRATGWGETPLSVAWVWPSESLDWKTRETALCTLCQRLADAWRGQKIIHPFLSGHEMAFTLQLTELSRAAAGDVALGETLPYLAALACQSAFDLALYDAWASVQRRTVFSLFGASDLPCDLGRFLGPDFAGRYPGDFLAPRRDRLPVWHLVGGLDPLEPQDITPPLLDDGYPRLLRDWIRRDGLRCLKIKLRGTDPIWDYERIVRVGQIALEEGVDWLSADFNCTVLDPAVIIDCLDRLIIEHPHLYARLLYIEQPFPYDLERHHIDVRAISSRKPLFLDESAHDWQHVRLGASLGWNGVALKTCKTLTGAMLSLAWARQNGMSLMVQDLTNPMLAIIPHAQLAAHCPTLMGVECNAMQFYPEASAAEEKIHPGLYRRRTGEIDLSTLDHVGFGARVSEIARALPTAA